MSSIPPSGASVPDRTLALPARPNLEFERKRAKRMLHAIENGDDDAHARVRRYRRDIHSTQVKLTDVQLTLAREYGFSSWPRLTAYFETWNLHERTGPRIQGFSRAYFENKVKHVMHAHAHGKFFATHNLAAFIPRFYGRHDAEILSTPITEREAQMVVARLNRFSSWAALLEAHDRPHGEEAKSEADVRASQVRRFGEPFVEACDAIKRRDIPSLSRAMELYPKLLRTRTPDTPGDLLLRRALMLERQEPGPETRAVSDWLVARGADLAATLNPMLLERIKVSTTDIAFLLERGADPNWVPLNGVTVLEYALLRYWNPEAVDMIAKRVTPRKAFWIAAGLGDVPGMLRYLDRKGKPTSAARRRRPDFIVAGLDSVSCRPDADDLEILWEGFAVAGFNQRLGVIDALLDNGFPIDYSAWGSTLLQWARGNGFVALADHLIKRGAREPG